MRGHDAWLYDEELGDVTPDEERGLDGMTETELEAEFAQDGDTEEETVQRFELGALVATPAAIAACGEATIAPSELFERHASGDWGDVPKAGAKENELSVREGYRIISSYPVGDDGERVWVITEADRSSTCLLLPWEY